MHTASYSTFHIPSYPWTICYKWSVCIIHFPHTNSICNVSTHSLPLTSCPWWAPKIIRHSGLEIANSADTLYIDREKAKEGLWLTGKQRWRSQMIQTFLLTASSPLSHVMLNKTLCSTSLRRYNTQPFNYLGSYRYSYYFRDVSKIYPDHNLKRITLSCYTGYKQQHAIDK